MTPCLKTNNETRQNSSNYLSSTDSGAALDLWLQPFILRGKKNYKGRFWRKLLNTHPNCQSIPNVHFHQEVCASLVASLREKNHVQSVFFLNTGHVKMWHLNNMVLFIQSSDWQQRENLQRSMQDSCINWILGPSLFYDCHTVSNLESQKLKVMLWGCKLFHSTDNSQKSAVLSILTKTLNKKKLKARLQILNQWIKVC